MNDKLPSDHAMVLVAVSVQAIRPSGMLGVDRRIAQYAVLQTESETQELCFTTDSNPLSPEMLEAAEKPRDHGFTVIALSQRWRYEYEYLPGGWLDFVLGTQRKRTHSLQYVSAVDHAVSSSQR